MFNIFFDAHTTADRTDQWNDFICMSTYMYVYVCVVTCIFYMRVCTGSSRRERQMEIRGEKAEVF